MSTRIGRRAGAWVGLLVGATVILGAVTAPSQSRNMFVTVCGSHLCLKDKRFRIKSAAAYGQYGNPRAVIAEARAAGLNTLKVVEFDRSYHELSDTEASDTWARVDRFIAAASAAHMHVILNLSEYGQSLEAAGYTMGSLRTSSTWPNLGWQGDWDQYLRFVANRRNTVTKVVYKADPTIAMIELWGEIPAPGSVQAVGSSSEMQIFFARTLSAWHSLAPNILASTGGFSYLNSPQSRIPWRTIFAEGDDPICDIEINSTGDRNLTVAMVTKYCQRLGKPWFLSAWSACSKPKRGDWDIDDWLQSTPAATDAAMAAHVKDMYRITAGGTPATYKAIGSDFWSLGPATSNTCQLGPMSPERLSHTWAAVRRER